jgi:hypothetical protein
MQIQIETRAPDSVEFRELAERRTRFVMRRLAWMVSRAEVQLSDANGPRGGIDKRCQVMLKAGNRNVLVVRSRAGDWRTALDTALGRAARLLLRVWQRARQPTRRREGISRSHRDLAAAGS